MWGGLSNKIHDQVSSCDFFPLSYSTINCKCLRYTGDAFKIHSNSSSSLRLQRVAEYWSRIFVHTSDLAPFFRLGESKGAKSTSGLFLKEPKIREWLWKDVMLFFMEEIAMRTMWAYKPDNRLILLNPHSTLYGDVIIVIIIITVLVHVCRYSTELMACWLHKRKSQDVTKV